MKSRKGIPSPFKGRWNPSTSQKSSGGLPSEFFMHFQQRNHLNCLPEFTPLYLNLLKFPLIN
jgi:hypothetical protein